MDEYPFLGFSRAMRSYLSRWGACSLVGKPPPATATGESVCRSYQKKIGAAPAGTCYLYFKLEPDD